MAQAASQLPQEEQERIAQQQAEFLQQQAEAAKQGKAAETGRHSAAIEANDRGLSSLLGHALGGSSSSSGQNYSGQGYGSQNYGSSSSHSSSGLGGLGAAAGAGGVGALLGSLLGSAANNRRYSSSYAHTMGPPPFMMGSGLGGMGMGMGGMGMGMGGGRIVSMGPFGMMGGPMGMGGMGMGPFGEYCGRRECSERGEHRQLADCVPAASARRARAVEDDTGKDLLSFERRQRMGRRQWPSSSSLWLLCR